MPTFTPASADLDRIEVALARQASSLNLTFDISARTIEYDSFVDQDNAITGPLPKTGYLVIAQFASEKCADMLGPTSDIAAVATLAEAQGQLVSFLFDYLPAPALTAYLFDLATGDPVQFKVIREVRVAGLQPEVQ
jgi:hypothetical protein